LGLLVEVVAGIAPVVVYRAQETFDSVLPAVYFLAIEDEVYTGSRIGGNLKLLPFLL
jgi:hypothetical protein